MRRTVTTMLLLLGPALSAPAAPEGPGKVELQTIAEKEIRIVNDKGEEEIRKVPAAKVIPGEEVIYTIRVTNVSEEAVADIVITDPVPDEMVYREGTATGTRTQITFSVDGGTTYAAPEALKVAETDGTLRPAAASDYTHIRWQFSDPLHPGQSRSVLFRAKLQ